jgi:Arc/MetJ family transcription regulator
MMRMARTTVDIDLAALDAARSALHTEGVSATINAALRDAARRAQLTSFDVRALPDLAAPDEIESARHDRDHLVDVDRA